jgi:hypothetical protein
MKLHISQIVKRLDAIHDEIYDMTPVESTTRQSDDNAASEVKNILNDLLLGIEDAIAQIEEFDADRYYNASTIGEVLRSIKEGEE